MDLKGLSKLDMPTEDLPVGTQRNISRERGGNDTWRCLTAVESKWLAYSLEATLRASLHDAIHILGDDWKATLQAHCHVLVKPDGMVSRRASAVIDYMQENNFVLVNHEFRASTPLENREIWRYQWNVATLDRLALFDLIMQQSSSLSLYFRDTTVQPTMPAAVRLRGLKGSALPELRNVQSLRSVCAAPNRILTFIHASDEPIDLVREAGITYTTVERIHLFEKLRSSIITPANVIAEDLQKFYVHTPNFIFDCERSFELIDQLLSELNEEAHQHFLSLTEDGESLYKWLRSYAYLLAQLPAWPFIAAASTRVLHDRKGHVCTIDEDGRQEWLAGDGDFHSFTYRSGS